MQTAFFQNPREEVIFENSLHNRLNFRADPCKYFGFTLETRLRLVEGQFFDLVPDYSLLLAQDHGLADLTENIIAGRSFALTARIDRLYAALTLNKTEITLGRQRINWGQCFAWNPNDIFNAYSFFDFDYEEKPGSDAVRLQYYPSALSTLEFAFKADNRGRLTAAALYRFNKWKYDFQFLGGIYDGKNLVAGTGWSGNIGNAGFRGEVSYFHPYENIAGSTGYLLAAMGAEYVFRNSFFLQAEALYNMDADEVNTFLLANMQQDIRVRNLSFTEYSLLVNASYPVSPLATLSLAGMYFPKKNGFFAGPSVTYSVSDNASFALSAQTFGGEFTGNEMEYYTLVYLRMRINF